ncbi:glycosyltransferase 87 family protein [Streptomyces sp. NPDC004134]|uniref:glycosyltransferase 87 family protein n=1 Tax=Streptomyces sp. NPDC004134 TaxID=3364691 RepID=UPI00367F5A3C
MTTTRKPPGDTRTAAAVLQSFLARHGTAVALLWCALSLALFWWAQRAAHVSMIDLAVYRAEGWAVRTGENLYALRVTDVGLRNTYPPFAAVLFVPLTWLGVGEMRTLATVVNLLLAGVAVHLSLKLVAGPSRIPSAAAGLAVTGLVVWSEPVWTTLRYGQINLLILVLVLWDLTRRPGSRWSGAGTGLAAGIKITPGLFLVSFVLIGVVQMWRERQAGRRNDGKARLDAGGADGGRAGAGGAGAGGCAGARAGRVWLRRGVTAGVTFAATIAAAAVVVPEDSRRFWGGLFLSANRVGRADDPANQSLRGVMARLLHTTDPGTWWLPVAALTLAAGLAVTTAAALAGPRLESSTAWTAVCCAMTALLISPVTWSHHWVWCVPLIVLLGSQAWRRVGVRWWYPAGGAVVVFLTYGVWLVPNRLGQPDLGTWHIFLSALYPAAAIAVLAVGAHLAVQALRDRSPRENRAPGPDGEIAVP